VPFLALFLASPGILPGQETPLQLKVVAEQANVRLAPDITSIIIKQVPRGTLLESPGKRGEWFAVRLVSPEGREVSGFVHESLVVELSPVPEKERPHPRIEAPPPEKPRPREEAQEPPSSPPGRWAVTLTGGGGTIIGGDLNEGARGLVDYQRIVLGGTTAGSVSPVRLATVFGGALDIPLAPNISLQAGVEYLSGSRESVVSLESASGILNMTVQPEIQALPLSLSLSLDLLPSLVLRAGPVYTIARCSYLYRLEEGETIKHWKGRANGQGIGFQGGIGLSKDITPRLSLVVEVTGRYTRISGFKGKDTFTDSSGQNLTEEGNLYAYKVEATENTAPLVVFIREQRPREAGVLEAREARLDLSGIGIRAGLRFRF